MLQQKIYVGQLLTINPSMIFSRPWYEGGPQRGTAWLRNALNNLENRCRDGKLSKQAKRKLINSVNWLAISARRKRVYEKKTGKTFFFKLSFITLTIPVSDVKISPKQATSMLLNPWLTYARKYLGLRNYIWKLELTKKGTVHFHVTSDSFLHWRMVRHSWNALLQRRGLLDNYILSHGHSDANSTDVHSVAKIRNMAAYIAKYVTKSSIESDLPFGRIWGCNYELSRAVGTQLELFQPEAAKAMPTLFQKVIEWKRVTIPDKMGGQPIPIGEAFFIKAHQWLSTIKGEIKEKFEEVCDSIRAVSANAQFALNFAEYEVCR